MCWQCDNPGATTAEYLDFVRGLIDRHGWAVQGVEGDRIRPPWAYTVGLTAFGLPELVVTGMPHGRSANLLNGVADHITHADLPGPGDRVALDGGPDVEFVALTQADAHLYVAVAFYGPDVRGLQIAWADDRGHWPWEVGFRGTRGGQPILGRRYAA